MKLGTKINLVLTMVIALVLTAAFWIIIDIQGRNLKNQVVNDAETVTNILRLDIERILSQIHAQEARLQEIVDLSSRTTGVRYMNINDAENKYIATTNHTLAGEGISSADRAVVLEVKKTRNLVAIKRDKGGYYEIDRHVPVFANAKNIQPEIIGVISVSDTTSSYSSVDVLDTESVIKAAVASVEQSARSTILSRNDGINSLQRITDSVIGSNFFHNFVILDGQLEVISSMTGGVVDFVSDPAEYKQLREDTLVGKISAGNVERLYNGVPVIMHVVPITTYDEKTKAIKNIGLVEVHILKQSYETSVNDLKIRMLGVGIVFTVTLVVVLAVILDREVVGPIRRYSVIARKIADGDFTQAVEHTSNDEIGQFGDVFNSMVKNLRELDKMKSDFISVAAHQLRTPLSGVKWVLKLLLDGDLGEINSDQKGMLKRGFETNEKMIQLVNDLLNVSRIENGKFGYKFDKNDFMKLLSTLLDNTVLASKERNIEVLLDNRAGVIPEFWFDSEKLLIAFQNIVDNAMKYTLPGGRVLITVEKKGDYLQVKISDTGVGIPKADIARLFSKFFRAANVIHLQTDGSGLGLFIVKSIILRHGGQIWVDSVEEKGTTFTIVVPMVAELLPKEEQVQESPEETGS